MQVETITDSSHRYFREAWAIYEYSFPAFEQRRLDAQKQIIEDDRYRFDVFLEADQVMAIIGYWEFPDFIYLEHLATSRDFRNGGRGAKILQTMFRKHVGKRLILDIDPPVDEISKRRLGFYERLGFQRNSYRFAHTPYHSKQEPFLLEVLSYPKALTPEQFSEFQHTHTHEVMRTL